MNVKDSLFVEKYRPRSINECILPSNIKSTFNDYVKNKNFQNLLLSGSPGSGKTSSALALCNELKLDYIFINSGETGTIDNVRTTIRSFCTTKSFHNSLFKVVILDEADGMSHAAQTALKGFIEEFYSTTRFILTVNFTNKIIEPIISRCSEISFTISKNERKDIIGEIDNKLKNILDLEKIKYDKKTLAEIIVKYFPDLRKILNEIQRNSVSGILNKNIVFGSEQLINNLISSIKEKNFNNIRKWVVDNGSNIDMSSLIKVFYNKISDYVEGDDLVKLIFILNKYDFQNSFSIDKEINLSAMLLDIMVSVKIK